MPPFAQHRLEESDMVRRELRDHVGAVVGVEQAEAGYLGIPDTGVRILVRRWPGCTDVDAHVIGPRTHLLRKATRPNRALAIELVPGAAPELLGVAAYELADHATSLRDVWGRDADPLYELLAGAPYDQHGAIVQTALIERLSAARCSTDRRRALRGATTLLDHDPDVRIAGLASELGVSDRQLRRWFQDAIGLTPKRYARVLRLRRAIGMAQSQSLISWAELALDAGYYDQAHMIGEFRTATGLTPPALLAELSARAGGLRNPSPAVTPCQNALARADVCHPRS
jgi:AraC-like DNA-binding protein